MKRFLSLTLCLLWLPLSFAQTTQQIEQFYRMEAVAYRVFGEMSICSNQNSSAMQKRLDEVLLLGDEYEASLAQHWPLIAQNWQQVRAFIHENRSDEALTQAAFAARLGEVMDEMFASFEIDRPDINKLPADLQVDVSLLLGLDKMLAGYAYFNATLFGGHAFVNTYIEDENQAFEKNIAKLPESDFKAQLKRNWDFVKETLLAYNERSALFIVDRTGHKMRQLLLQQASLKNTN